MKRTILLFATIGVALAAGARAEPVDYVFDMSHSRIYFDVNHRGFSTMLGRFAEFDGTFRFDADDPTASTLDIAIAAASVDMFHEGLNNHLKNQDFFDVERYPEMRFDSERVEQTADGRFAVHGQFTLLGVTHPLSFDVVLNDTGRTRAGAPMAGFTAHGTLDRTQYGMTYGAPLVGTQISFRIEIEASARTES